MSARGVDMAARLDAARARLKATIADARLLPALYDLLGRLVWELRAAWANGRRVALTLEHCDVDRVEGVVTRVSATGATAVVGGTLVPLDRALAIHWPSRLGDGARSGRRGAGFAPRVHPDQLDLPAVLS